MCGHVGMEPLALLAVAAMQPRRPPATLGCPAAARGPGLWECAWRVPRPAAAVFHAAAVLHFHSAAAGCCELRAPGTCAPPPRAALRLCKGGVGTWLQSVLIRLYFSRWLAMAGLWTRSNVRQPARFPVLCLARLVSRWATWLRGNAPGMIDRHGARLQQTDGGVRPLRDSSRCAASVKECTACYRQE